uniref:Uncharacterized protein n=1 Tax=Sphaerodactylus townsendi TaxID=933632 RepID=A0ACB8EES8_9SAUR
MPGGFVTSTAALAHPPEREDGGSRGAWQTSGPALWVAAAAAASGVPLDRNGRKEREAGPTGVRTSEGARPVVPAMPPLPPGRSGRC